jgi:hypothetical protein
VVDAAPAPVTVDAAPAIPEAELIKVQIVTIPEGATIIKDGTDQPGVTPMNISVVKSNKEVSLIAKLNGFDDHEFKFNPLEIAKNPVQKVTLKKVKPGRQPIQIVPKQGSGTNTTGSGTAPPPDGLGGSPYGPAGSGTVPPKK